MDRGPRRLSDFQSGASLDRSAAEEVRWSLRGPDGWAPGQGDRILATGVSASPPFDYGRFRNAADFDQTEKRPEIALKFFDRNFLQSLG